MPPPTPPPVHAQLVEFAKVHNGEFIIVDHGPDSQGRTMDRVTGTLRGNFIIASPDSADKSSYVFPSVARSYKSIMTSRNGQDVSGVFYPDPADVGSPDCPDMLAALSAAASATDMLLRQAAVSFDERQQLAAATHQAVAERNELLQRTQAAEAAISAATDQREQLGAALTDAERQRTTATQQRDHLHAETERAESERNMLLEELRLARADRTEMRSELSSLRQELTASQVNRQSSPQPTVPQAPGNNNFTLQDLTQALRGLSASPEAHQVTVKEAHPFLTSHGEHCDPMIDPETTRRFAQNDLEPYRWLKTNTAIGNRIRDAIVEMDHQLCDESRFPSWCERVTFTLTPTQWCLYTTGSFQARLELGAALRTNDPGVQSLLIFARQRCANPWHLADLVSGAQRLTKIPLLGSHNGATNLATLPTSVHARAAREASRDTASSTKKDANKGNGNPNNRQRQLHGAGDQPPPNLSALNALVRVR